MLPSKGNLADGARALPLAGLVSKLREHREGDLRSARKAGPVCFWVKLLRVCLGTCPLGWGEHGDEDLALVGTDPRPEPLLPPFFPFC